MAGNAGQSDMKLRRKRAALPILAVIEGVVFGLTTRMRMVKA
ncbi:MAG: hypothetical protein ABW003_24020 [Microvirga sp.]